MANHDSNLYINWKDMKKTLTYELRDNYRGVAYVDNAQVLIYIEASRKVFFGLFTTWDRICKPTLFELGYKDSEHAGCTLNGVFLGRYMTLSINQRDITKFNIRNEIYKKFDEVLDNIKRLKVFNKQLNNL